MIYICKTVGAPFLKIGFSESMGNRVKQMQTNSPFEIICLAERSGSIALEKAIHKNCSKFRVRGEWFQDCDEVRTYFFTTYDPWPSFTTGHDIDLQKKKDACIRTIHFSEGHKIYAAHNFLDFMK